MGSIYTVLDNKLYILFIILIGIKENLGSDYSFEDGHLSDRLIKELYRKYKEAVYNDSDLVILRRQFNDNRLFEIHIKKLKEVNGFKKHNLMVKGKLRTGRNPFIYINNPVESKIPNAYLTLEEFKDALTKRIEKQRPKTTPRHYLLVVNTEKIKKNKYKLISRTSYESQVKTSISTGSFRSTKKSDINDLKSLTNERTSRSEEKITNAIVVSNENSSEATKPSSISWIKQTEETVIAKPLTESNNLKRNDSSTAKIEELIFLRASPKVDDHTQAEEYNAGISENIDTTITASSMDNILNTNDTAIANISYITYSNVTDIGLISDRSITSDRTTKEGIDKTSTNVINITTNMVDLSSNGIPELYSTSENPIISDNTMTQVVISNSFNITNISEASYVKDVETITEGPLEQVNTTQVMVNTSISSETTKSLPKQVVTKLETVSFARNTPWRKRAPSSKRVTKNTSTVRKRSTLGRPLVFMGGP